MLDQLEGSKLFVLTDTTLIIAVLTTYHNMMLSVGFMEGSRDYLGHISADVLFVAESADYISHT
jgi:hypothetical protein